jgi:hypothetical protein
MLLVTEISGGASRAAARAHLQAHEGAAREFAAQFSAGAIANLGPVAAEGGGILAFQMAVAGSGALVPVTILVGPEMPECDVWCTWALVLEECGLRVSEDTAYQAIVWEAADLEAEAVETGQVGHCAAALRRLERSARTTASARRQGMRV